MDHLKFDNLARAMSRRTTLRGLVALAIGGSGLAVATGDADAAQQPTCRTINNGCTRNSQCCTAYCERRSNVPRRHRHRCTCPDGQGWCGGACIDLGTDENCAGCGDVCTGFETCVSGQCTDPCSLISCDVDEACFDGACYPKCGDGDTCGMAREVCMKSAGACIPIGCYDLSGASQCIVDSYGRVFRKTVGNWLGGVCEVNEDCLNGAPGGVAPVPDWPSTSPGDYYLACVMAWVQSRAYDPTPQFANGCYQFVRV